MSNKSKKILFATEPSWNQEQQYTHIAMCELFGHENVVDIPYKPWLHGSNMSPFLNPTVTAYFENYAKDSPNWNYRLPQLHEFMQEIETHLDNYNRNVDSFISMDEIYCGVDPFEWARVIPPVIYDRNEMAILDEQILTRAKDFDLLICSPYEVSLWFTRLIKEKNPNIPVVIIDCDDGVQIRDDIMDDIDNVVLYVKFQLCNGWGGYNRDQYGNIDVDPRVYGSMIPSTYIDVREGTSRYEVALKVGKEIPDLDDSWENKIYDLQVRKSIMRYSRVNIYRGVEILKSSSDMNIDADYKWNIDNPIQHDPCDSWRCSVEEAIEEGDLYADVMLGYHPSNKHKYFPIDVKKIPFWDMINRLSHSKIAVQHSGMGPVNTFGNGFGFMEVPSSRTMLLAGKSDNIYDNPFIDGEHCVYYDQDDPYDFVDKVKYFIKNENECHEIALNGYNHVKRYHSMIAYAERIMNRIEGNL